MECFGQLGFDLGHFRDGDSCQFFKTAKIAIQNSNSPGKLRRTFLKTTNLNTHRGLFGSIDMAKIRLGIKRLQDSEAQRLQFAAGLIKNKQFDAALVELSAILAENPSCVRAHVSAGMCYRTQQLFDASIPHFQAALQLDPFEAQIPLELGKTYVRQGKWKEALVQYHNAINLNAQFSPAYVCIARVLSMQNQLKEAWLYFERGLELDPENAVIHLDLADIAKKQDNLPVAIAQLTLALQKNNQLSLGYHKLGSIYFQQRKYNLAERAFARALDLNPNAEFSRLGLARSLIRQNNLAAANVHLASVGKGLQTV
jgi:Tfp pilus assembly protein PilF